MEKMMNVFQLYLKVFLMREIKQEYSLMEIASFIDEVLVKNPQWAKLHNENCYKNYCFNSFYKPEPDGKYRKEQVYQIMIRSVDRNLMQYLEENLPKHENASMKGLVCSVTIVKQRHIKALYSITPVVVKGPGQTYWRDEMDFAQFGQQIKVNLIKKYQGLLGGEINENIELFTLLELTNRTPIAIPYKSVKLLADKVQMQIADNLVAQQLAFMSLGTGAGTMNARGYGFVNAHFM